MILPCLRSCLLCRLELHLANVVNMTVLFSPFYSISKRVPFPLSPSLSLSLHGHTKSAHSTPIVTRSSSFGCKKNPCWSSIERHASYLSGQSVIRISIQLCSSALLCFFSWLRLPLANVPSPAPQCLDYFGCDGGSQGHADKDEGLVDGVSKSELRPDSCRGLC